MPPGASVDETATVAARALERHAQLVEHEGYLQ
jgi:hypothetical protein